MCLHSWKATIFFLGKFRFNPLSKFKNKKKWKKGVKKIQRRDIHVISILISKISHEQLSVFEYMIFVKEIRHGFFKIVNTDNLYCVSIHPYLIVLNM